MHNRDERAQISRAGRKIGLREALAKEGVSSKREICVARLSVKEGEGKRLTVCLRPGGDNRQAFPDGPTFPPVFSVLQACQLGQSCFLGGYETLGHVRNDAGDVGARCSRHRECHQVTLGLRAHCVASS